MGSPTALDTTFTRLFVPTPRSDGNSLVLEYYRSLTCNSYQKIHLPKMDQPDYDHCIKAVGMDNQRQSTHRGWLQDEGRFPYSYGRRSAQRPRDPRPLQIIALLFICYADVAVVASHKSGFRPRTRSPTIVSRHRPSLSQTEYPL